MLLGLLTESAENTEQPNALTIVLILVGVIIGIILLFKILKFTLENFWVSRSITFIVCGLTVVFNLLSANEEGFATGMYITVALTVIYFVGPFLFQTEVHESLLFGWLPVIDEKPVMSLGTLFGSSATITFIIVCCNQAWFYSGVCFAIIAAILNIGVIIEWIIDYVNN